MPGDPGAVLSATVIEAIEQRLKHLGSPTLTPAEVAAHNTEKSCYIRLLDYVFDVTAFLKRHPGGEKILLQQAGDKDRSSIFAGVHSNKAAKMLPDLLVGTISGACSRGQASLVHPRAPAPVPEPSGSLTAPAPYAKPAIPDPASVLTVPSGAILPSPSTATPLGPLNWASALARRDSQGSVFSDSSSNLQALEAFEIDVQTYQGKSLEADAEASGELQDAGQSTQEGAAHCEEVQLSFGQEASPENAQHTVVSLAGQDQRPKIAEPGDGTAASQGEIHSAAASKSPRILPFEPEATAEIIGPTCSSALQDAGQSTQEGAAHCEEVQLSFGQEASPENVQHSEVSLAGQDQRPKIAEPGDGTGAGQGEIHSAAASKYPRILPFEPEATAAIIDPTCSSATHTMKAPAGGTLDAKTGSPKAGHTLVGAESKCPFAAILKAAGHDIAGMSMPANHKAAHNDLPTGSPLSTSSDTAGLFTMPRNRSSRGLSGMSGGLNGMSELQAVPETRPMVVDSDVEDGIELESAELSPLRGTRSRLGSLLESKESQGRRRDSISSMNAAGWSMAAGSSKGNLSGSEKQVFKLPIHEGYEAASQSSHNSHASASSKGTASKQSSRGRATARKRRQRIARAKGNKVDMGEWNRHVGTIKDFWENLFKGVSIAGLGTSLLDTVETDDTLEPLFRYTNKEVQGTKFMDMLCFIVDNINSPEMIHAKIGELGGMHYRLGVRAAHMPLMKEALFSTLQRAAGNIFTEDVQVAWTLVWDYMTVAMAQTLEDEGSTMTLVLDSWGIVTENKTAREVGERLYDHLFTLVPNVKHMFSKSREEMAIKMGDALETVISCAENPGSLQEQLRSLGLRHVLYKVLPHHIPLMGPPLITTLAEQLGGDWNPEVERAWAQLFEVVCETMATSIREGMDHGGVVHELIRAAQLGAKVDLRMWEAADKDMSGSIGFEEFASMSCHVGISKPKLRKVFEKLDADGSGEVDKEEFSHYKGEMDREASIGHIIAKELPADLALLMKEQGSGPSKVERAASSLNKKRRAAHGDLTNLFEVSAAKLAPTEQKPPLLARSQSAAGLSNWRIALTPVRAVQGMLRPSMTQPPPPPTEAAVATQEPGVTAGKGSKWKTVLNAVKAVDEMKSHVDPNPGDSDDSPTSAGGGPSLPDPSDDRSPESQGNGNAHAGKEKWKTALTSVKTANGLRRHFSETKQEQQPEDHTADFVGLELWDFLCETAELIFVPQKQRELIFSYATPFYNRGMRSGHLVEMGKAIESVFRHTLPFDQYGEKQRAAWEWLWSNISHTLGHELDVLEKDWNLLVLESWQLIQQRADVDALGQDFWKRLNDIAPDQTHVFRRPLKMWGHLLHHIVNTLVLSISSPDTFFDQIFQLTVRHIRYGVRPHYLPPFGQAFMETFEQILKEEWTAETHQAWQELWKRAADSMMRGLNFGGSPLVHALVDGSVDHLRDAIAEFPRQERAVKLCQVDIEKSTVSPLFWALHDSKHELVDFILNDLLTIRADLHGYYYGRELLFKHHPDLVGILGLNGQQLLVTLLDGHVREKRQAIMESFEDNDQQLRHAMLLPRPHSAGLLWHSREKTDRKVRVSYFIAELYGRPDEYHDPWNSPLARLVKFADHTTFAHPVVCKLLDVKWEAYGMKLFLVQEAWYLQHLLIYTIDMNLEDNQPGNACHDGVSWILRRVLIVLSIFNTLVQFLSWAMQIYHGKVKTVKVRSWTFSVPRTATNTWLWLRVGSWIAICWIYSTCDCAVMNGYLQPCLALQNGSYVPEGCRQDSRSVIYSMHNLTWEVQYHEKDGLEWRQIGGVQDDRALISLAGMLFWGQVLECSILSEKMAAFTFSLGIMIEDLSHPLFFIGILLLAFGSALTNIADEGYDQGLDVTLADLLKNVLGMGRNHEGLSSLSVFLQIIFIIFVTIIMLNVLIAQLSLTYGKVMTFARPSMLKYRASVILDLESLLPHFLRQRVYDSLGFDVPLPLSVSDVGPAGGIQVWEWESHCPGYIPDRIKRYSGDATPQDPWPKHDSES